MLNRAFVSLYISVFVATMGISMVSPLLPVYAKDLGASGIWLGLTFSSFAIVQVFVGPFSGRLSDRYGRKPFIAAGLIIYMVAALGYLTAQSFWQVLAFRAFSGLGTSFIFSVARAYLGDMTPRGHEGRWAGVFATADIFGFGTGPLFAGIFRELIGFRSVFVAMAILMAASAVIIITCLPARVNGEKRATATEAGVGFRRALQDRLVVALMANIAVVSLGVGASLSFLALRLEGDIGTSPLLIGVAFATQDITSGIAQPFFGRMADQYNRPLLVAIGLSVNGALLIGLALANTYALIVLVLLAMGASGALSQVTAGAIQVVAGRRVGMGTLLGLNSAGNGLGIVLGSVVGGIIVETRGIGTTFVLGGVVTMVGALVFVVLTRGVRTTEPMERPVSAEAWGQAAAGGT